MIRTLLHAAVVLTLAMSAARAQVAVVTQHYDNGRTGWNANETVLTPALIARPGAFGRTAVVALDGIAQAQPLVVPGIAVAGDPNAGSHDVVYVATAGNTVYAIDPERGTVLRSRNFGIPVHRPTGCNGTNPASVVGITSTPVIDLGRHAMYLIAYTVVNKTAAFVLHAIDLSTLADVLPPVTVTAVQQLADGSSYVFDPRYQRQRPALLEANGAIYAGFGSFCDFSGTLSRGWVLGWNADTLVPLAVTQSGQPAGALMNRLASQAPRKNLSSVWMSGSGLAADASGVYFVTGNSNASGTAYNSDFNLPHSVLLLSFDTTARLDVFTPSNVAFLEQTDGDFGSGGIMLLPPQGDGVPPLATAAGKFGAMYLLNRNDLGGFTPGGPDRVLDAQPIGHCACAESYFAAPQATIVGSGANRLTLWHLAPPGTKLVKYGQSPVLISGAPGETSFFTAVSSHGGDPDSVIIWAALRPGSDTINSVVHLTAFTPRPSGKNNLIPQLYSADAGTGYGVDSTTFAMPVVANGRVYVASNRELAIFGVLPVPPAP